MPPGNLIAQMRISNRAAEEPNRQGWRIMPAFYDARATKPLCGFDPSPKRDAIGSLGSNLSLAARPRVGHIGLNGAVAEWLKAAVC